MITPKAIRQKSESELAIDWSDGHSSVYPVRLLRLNCRCANCVEEMSGRPMLDPATVPADVKPVQVSPVGRYAIHIQWSDSHTSGIYTYEHLRNLCPCPDCENRRAESGERKA